MSNQSIGLAQVFHLSHKYSFLFFLDILKKIHDYKEVDPFSVEIHPTYACNLDCKFCYNQSFRRDSGYFSIKEEHWTRILQLIENSRSIKNVVLNGGGEPFMYPRDHLRSLFDLARKRNILVTMVTNGTLLGNFVLDQLRENHCLINISIKSIERASFSYLTGKDLFERQMENLDRCLLMRRQANHHLVVARYVFAEPIPNDFDVDHFASFVAGLFGKGLDAFLVTFSNPFSFINRKKSSSYSAVYEKIIKNKDLASFFLRGDIRFSNLRYLSGDYPDICSSASVQHSGHFRCYVKEVFSLINPRGISQCPSGHSIEGFPDGCAEIADICRQCGYFSYNTSITRTLNHLASNGVKQPTLNYVAQHVDEVFGGFVTEHSLVEIKQFLRYVSESENRAIQGLPYVLH